MKKTKKAIYEAYSTISHMSITVKDYFDIDHYHIDRLARYENQCNMNLESYGDFSTIKILKDSYSMIVEVLAYVIEQDISSDIDVFHVYIKALYESLNDINALIIDEFVNY